MHYCTPRCPAWISISENIVLSIGRGRGPSYPSLAIKFKPAVYFLLVSSKDSLPSEFSSLSIESGSLDKLIKLAFSEFGMLECTSLYWCLLLWYKTIIWCWHPVVHLNIFVDENGCIVSPPPVTIVLLTMHGWYVTSKEFLAKVVEVYPILQYCWNTVQLCSANQ
jgi:hypothetical protein